MYSYERYLRRKGTDTDCRLQKVSTPLVSTYVSTGESE